MSLTLAASGTPSVIVHNLATDSIPYTIYHDDAYGSFQLTRYLIELGHTRLAYVGEARKGRETQDRLRGFRQAIKAARLKASPEFITNVQSESLHPIAEVVRAWMQSSSAPTALVCYNDVVAMDVMESLRQLGKQVPQDCSVVGFDNISFSSYVHPRLTTFDQPKYELGRAAAQMLLRQLENSTKSAGEGDTEVISLRGQLLIRDSTAAPPDSTSAARTNAPQRKKTGRRKNEAAARAAGRSH